MTFAEWTQRSVSSFRTIVQVDIAKLNLQWVNAGAGIWYVNFSATYPEVDSLFLAGFTAQTFGTIGSVAVDTVQYISVSSVSLLTTTEISFYYDASAGEVWVHMVNNDDPILHDVFLGVVYGYSYHDFTPVGASDQYAARLADDISISTSRDPLFFGKIQFDTGSLSLFNTDGAFDTFGSTNTFYGNQVRILAGFAEIDISLYQTMYSATIERVSIGENRVNMALADKRKALSKTITLTVTNVNALQVIRDLLYLHYGVIYNSTYYDTTAWAVAEALVGNVTIDIGTGKTPSDAPIIDIIEMICASVFGLFVVTPTGLFSFIIVDTTAAASTTIYATDIISYNEIDYDPTTIISSAKIGYAKSWPEGYTSPYTFVTNTTYEASTFSNYKVYNQKQFNTLLITATAASAYGETILLYNKDIHGRGTITVPISYYGVDVGDIVDIQIWRESQAMLGTVKCEITLKSISLSTGFINFGYRII